MVSLGKYRIFDILALALSIYASIYAPIFYMMRTIQFLATNFEFEISVKNFTFSFKDNYFSFGNIKRDFVSIKPV